MKQTTKMSRAVGQLEKIYNTLSVSMEINLDMEATAETYKRRAT